MVVRRAPAWLPAAATVVLATASAGVVAYADRVRMAADAALPAQGLCLAAAAMWLAFATAPAARRWRPPRLDAARIVPPLVILGLAFALRAHLGSVLPFPDRTGFEELQMGSDGHRLLTTGVLPLEFRFTKALSAVGLWWGGNSLEALRLPFRLMGYGRLVATLLCLRALGAGWWPTACVTLAAAASRWFVITSGAAYEDFSASLFLLMLVLCLLKANPVRPASRAWAAFAGMFAGILVFENSSFRFALALALAWFVWLALVRWRREDPSTKWRPALMFAAVGALVSAPMLIDIVHGGVQSIFFEAVTRCASDRSTAFSPFVLENLRESFRMLAGLPVRISFYLAPENGHAVHPALGALLVAGAAAALLWPSRAAVRAIVLSALLAVVVCSLTTNYFAASRLAPVASLLLLSAGAFLHQAEGWVARAVGTMGTALRLPSRTLLAASRIVTPALITALTATMVIGNARRIREMAADVNVRREYRNDQYLVAWYLATEVP
ncbi:MAG TPA: hypothetical protein VMT19_09230, partial [Thermoanaerobaculaceae bacterium]|nr:hypothetical protein [Thermoanaerobaculaceae bacterium]